MRVIDTIALTDRSWIIQLCVGDLTSVPREHAVDVLVVSAFPNDYSPTYTSLIGALWRKGLSVAALAEQKDVDLRQAFSCWLSQSLDQRLDGIPYKRILCFEPRFRGNPPEVVGDIFRALAPALAGPPLLQTVAMPVVAAGDQRYSISAMLDPLLDAAIHWMRAGMPLQMLKIVVRSHSQGEEALPIFRGWRDKVASANGQTLSRRHDEFDVFISYAHEDAGPVDVLVDHLHQNSLRLFLDRIQLSTGSAWQHRISSAIDRSKRLVAFYSPSYIQSKVCQEEFNIAWARARELEREIIFPVYWQTANLPTYMKMLLYSDCREAQVANLRQVAQQIASACAS